VGAGRPAGKFAFLLALNLFLFAAGALMEIYAAIVVLVPLLLPVAVSYGIDPVHFGVIFLAVMEMGFPLPAGRHEHLLRLGDVRQTDPRGGRVGAAGRAGDLPVLIALWPALATGLPAWLAR
jgi:C4-dicarboxylate transporter DctM subunit